METILRNPYTLTLEEWRDVLAEWGEPAYRARQIWQWLYRHLARDADAMTNLPKALRRRLAETFDFDILTPVTQLQSTDGHTRKWLLRLPDGEHIEAVLMEYDTRNTACISVQVGCAYACAFCATGQMGLIRNLTAGEIVAQIVHIERVLRAAGERPNEGHALTNIVFMGMGEPLSNYRETLKAIRILNHREGMAFGVRRMTLSTVGLVPAIRRLAEEPLQVNLAISLHAPRDDLRAALLPINAQYPIAELMEAVREYIRKTNRRVTFEYAMIDGINDDVALAHELGRLLEGMLAHVNLIPLNAVPGSPWQGSPRARVRAFADVLQASYNVPVTVRVRRGIDIAAGCGQLYAQVERRGRSIVPLDAYPTHAEAARAAARRHT
ncbi:MAG: 23S rRNA (adenine(2503)-C(2))-methyltransferase RlmN [Ardenticatenia bacterium]|nr:MAG: 23S rRNA (adenine(2503)-C(2))-methyltransferase RlmN [Ardenticatenia bacterium]